MIRQGGVEKFMGNFVNFLLAMSVLSKTGIAFFVHNCIK